MAVDVFGHPVEWDAIEKFAHQRGLTVVDDSCEALGAEYKGRKVGGFGDAAAFAFYPNKQMTTGEGGMIVTDNPEIAKLARSLRNQGRDEHGSWLSHQRLGFNYRLDEMSAALGCSQMKRLDSFLEKRQRVAQTYSARLAEVEGVRTPRVSSRVRMSWFVYVITLAPGIDRDRVMTAMEKRRVPARGYFAPIHLQPYMRDQTFRTAGDLLVTEDVGSRTLALPFHNNLSTAQVETVATALEESIAESRVS
jgi:perosamine synthetase